MRTIFRKLLLFILPLCLFTTPVRAEDTPPQLKPQEQNPNASGTPNQPGAQIDYSDPRNAGLLVARIGELMQNRNNLKNEQELDRLHELFKNLDETQRQQLAQDLDQRGEAGEALADYLRSLNNGNVSPLASALQDHLAFREASGAVYNVRVFDGLRRRIPGGLDTSFPLTVTPPDRNRITLGGTDYTRERRTYQVRTYNRETGKWEWQDRNYVSLVRNGREAGWRTVGGYYVRDPNGGTFYHANDPGHGISWQALYRTLNVRRDQISRDTVRDDRNGTPYYFPTVNLRQFEARVTDFYDPPRSVNVFRANLPSGTPSNEFIGPGGRIYRGTGIYVGRGPEQMLVVSNTGRRLGASPGSSGTPQPARPALERVLDRVEMPQNESQAAALRRILETLDRSPSLEEPSMGRQVLERIANSLALEDNSGITLRLSINGTGGREGSGGRVVGALGVAVRRSNTVTVNLSELFADARFPVRQAQAAGVLAHEFMHALVSLEVPMNPLGAQALRLSQLDETRANLVEWIVQSDLGHPDPDQRNPTQYLLGLTGYSPSYAATVPIGNLRNENGVGILQPRLERWQELQTNARAVQNAAPGEATRQANARFQQSLRQLGLGSRTTPDQVLAPNHLSSQMIERLTGSIKQLRGRGREFAVAARGDYVRKVEREVADYLAILNARNRS